MQGLGYGVLAGSLLVKVPQILDILRAKSARGLSAFSFELETAGLLIATSYGFLLHLPISAFGESVVSPMLAVALTLGLKPGAAASLCCRNVL